MASGQHRVRLDIGVYGARGIPSTYSGYETFLTTLLPELVDRGHTVTMYCRTGEGIDGETWKGVHRRVLPALPGKSVNTLSHGLVAALVARKARHDVVLAVNVANALYCGVGRMTAQPTVLNTDGQEWRRGKWGRAARTVFYQSARHAGGWASALVADCRAMADIYADDFGSPSTVIPYCAPSIDWEPDPAGPIAHDVEPGEYLVIAGRLNPENNIDKVAELVTASDLDLPLLVLGTANYDSPVTSRLAELAASDDRVRLIGHVEDRDEFLDLLHHAAVYVHGHSVGGINPSLIEAMTAGARIVALDTPFNREALGPDATTFSLDPPDLVDRLESTLAQTPAVEMEQRDAARQRIAEQYPIKAVVDAYESILLEASGQRRRRRIAISTRWATASK